jgi:hypothetical protein
MDTKEKFYNKLEQLREEQIDEATAISKIKQMAGPGKVVKKSPSDLSGKHHDVYLSQMINHDVYTHKGKDSVRAFKVHNKTKKVSEIKGQPPLMDEEAEQLDELRGKGTVDKKELQKHIRRKHDIAWEKTKEIRKDKDVEGSKKMDAYRNRLAKMHNKLDK